MPRHGLDGGLHDDGDHASAHTGKELAKHYLSEVCLGIRVSEHQARPNQLHRRDGKDDPFASLSPFHDQGSEQPSHCGCHALRDDNVGRRLGRLIVHDDQEGAKVGLSQVEAHEDEGFDKAPGSNSPVFGQSERKDGEPGDAQLVRDETAPANDDHQDGRRRRPAVERSSHQCYGQEDQNDTGRKRNRPTGTICDHRESRLGVLIIVGGVAMDLFPLRSYHQSDCKRGRDATRKTDRPEVV